MKVGQIVVIKNHSFYMSKNILARITTILNHRLRVKFFKPEETITGDTWKTDTLYEKDNYFIISENTIFSKL